MRERQNLSPEEMEALLAHSGGTPGAPSTPRALEGAGQPDRALLQEFVHFLLTGALQAQWGPGRVRRLEVEPAAADPWGGGDFPAAERAVRLAGGLTGVLAVGVWRPEGAGAAAGADAGGDDALASSLAADLPARMGRLLGIALDASPEAMAADSGGEPGGTPDEWVGFRGRVDGGERGVWELYIGFSSGLAGAIASVLQGHDGPDTASGPVEGTAGQAAPAARGGHSSPSSRSARSPLPGPIRPASFPVLEGREAEDAEGADVELLGDLVLRLTVEVGRARVRLEDLLQWRPGTVVVLDRLAGEMVDVLVNGKPVARGEVLVVEDFFTVKITDIVSPLDRVRGLNRG